MAKQILTFLHSGDMGDIIASLPTVKEICEREGAKAFIFLDTSGGLEQPEMSTSTVIRYQTGGKGLKFNRNGYFFLKPLLMAQDYIEAVETYVGDPVHYNLNRFRIGFFQEDKLKQTNQNLLLMHQVAFDLEPRYTGPWLTLPEKSDEQHDILISRTSRYQSAHVMYAGLESAFAKRGKFIGTDFEYDLYLNAFGYRPPRLQIETALDAAKAIANSKTFVTNGTVFYWIALGLGHPNIVHEIGCDIPTTIFSTPQPSVIYVEGMEFRTNSPDVNVEETMRRIITGKYDGELKNDKTDSMASEKVSDTSEDCIPPSGDNSQPTAKGQSDKQLGIVQGNNPED